MATKTSNKGKAVARAKQLIAGAEKHLAGTMQVNLVGSSFTPAEITTKIQSFVTLRSNVDAAKASTKEMLATEAAQMPALRTFISAFVTYVKAAYAGSPGALADFGITPKARAPLTVEEKAAAVAKRTATRAARHTMGPQQKKGVKGDVTGVVVTPTTAPVVTAPGSPTAPATSGGSTATGPAAPASPATSVGTPATTAPHTA